MKEVIGLFAAVLFLVGCLKSPEEQERERLDLRRQAIQTQQDSLRMLQATEMRKQRDQLRLQDMASGKICIDTVIRVKEIHDTILPTVDEVYSRYAKEICMIAIKMKKSSLSLDVFKHAKDEMNAVTLRVPVDRDYYDKLSIGQQLSESGVRMGSLMLRGEFSSWSLTVVEKSCVKR